MRIIFLPDTQCRKEHSFEFLKWYGKFIAYMEADVLIHGGDHWDLPSLSTFASRKEAEGARLNEDIRAGNEGMRVLMTEINKMKKKPSLQFLLGNHEARLETFFNNNPHLETKNKSYWKYFDLKGWNVHGFKEIYKLAGWNFCHYFYNQYTGRPFGGTAKSMIANVGGSFVAAHRQGIDIGHAVTNTGEQRWGIIAGSSYPHPEAYKGPQGNDHWRGLVMLDSASNGTADISIYSLENIKADFGHEL